MLKIAYNLIRNLFIKKTPHRKPSYILNRFNSHDFQFCVFTLKNVSESFTSVEQGIS